MSNNETWAILPEHQSHEVSDLGRVRNLKSGNVLKMSVNQYGLVYVTLRNTVEGKMENKTVGVLVASAFCPGRTLNENTVLHLDGDTSNNYAGNLMWATRWHVMAYHREIRQTSPRRSRKIKLTTLGAASVVFDGIHEAARATGCLPSAIDYACRYHENMEGSFTPAIHRTYPGACIFRYV